MSVFISHEPRLDAPNFTELPPLPEGLHQIRLRLTYSGPGWITREVEHTVEVRVAPITEPIIEPSTYAVVTDAVKATIGLSLSNAYGGEIDVRLHTQQLSDLLLSNTNRSASSPPIPVIAAIVELLDGERVVMRSCIFDRIEWHLRGTSPRERESLDEIRTLAFDRDTGTWKRDVLDRLTVRVRGDIGLALRDFDATRYWAGEFEMPVKDLLNR